LIVLVPDDDGNKEEGEAGRIGPLASAIAKAFPVFSKKKLRNLAWKQAKNGISKSKVD
jgi:hypothetical protein